MLAIVRHDYLRMPLATWPSALCVLETIAKVNHLQTNNRVAQKTMYFSVDSLQHLSGARAINLS
jgi:hypothetical protein